MQIRFTKPGLQSTVQDAGRILYLAQAVPVSGPMDRLAARIANIALGNTDKAAVIEFTYADAEFIAETDLLIAFAGDGAILKSGNQKLPSNRPVFIPQGTTVSLHHTTTGSHSYLAVAGGWDVAEVLSSRSTYLTVGFGGFKGRALQGGDILSNNDTSPLSSQIFDSLKGGGINYTDWSLPLSHLLPADKYTIRVIPGHEFHWFHGLSLADFLSSPYTLSMRSNRMGYHLEGGAINRIVKEELLSTAVTPGTIQVTGNGTMILLMADCQTTGGYPRIAQVAAVDLPLCGQLKPGDAIYFKEITYDEAEILYIEREKQLHKLSVAVKNKFL